MRLPSVAVSLLPFCHLPLYPCLSDRTLCSLSVLPPPLCCVGVCQLGVPDSAASDVVVRVGQLPVQRVAAQHYGQRYGYVPAAHHVPLLQQEHSLLRERLLPLSGQREQPLRRAVLQSGQPHNRHATRCLAFAHLFLLTHRLCRCCGVRARRTTRATRRTRCVRRRPHSRSHTLWPHSLSTA